MKYQLVVLFDSVEIRVSIKTSLGTQSRAGKEYLPNPLTALVCLLFATEARAPIVNEMIATTTFIYRIEYPA